MRNRSKTIMLRPGIGRYAAFLNEAPYAIRIAGVTWSTVAHYLMAQRYPGLETRIRWADVAELPAVLLWEQPLCERVNWSVVYEDYLYRALQAKFVQHLDLEQLLLATGEAQLVLLAPHDHYNGVDYRHQGHNMFGRLLMKVRRQITRQHQDYLAKLDRITRTTDEHE